MPADPLTPAALDSLADLWRDATDESGSWPLLRPSTLRALIQAARELHILTAPIEEVMAEAGLTEADTDAAYERLMAGVKTLDRVMMERDAAKAEAAAAARERDALRAEVERLRAALDEAKAALLIGLKDDGCRCIDEPLSEECSTWHDAARAVLAKGSS